MLNECLQKKTCFTQSVSEAQCLAAIARTVDCRSGQQGRSACHRRPQTASAPRASAPAEKAASNDERLGLLHWLDARRLLEEARPGAFLARALLHLRDGRVIGEATGVLTVLEVDVPALSPALAPAVPHDPVRRRRGGVVPDELDAVVEVHGTRGPASLVGHNSSSVGIPSAGIDADRNRAFGSGSRELVEVLVLASVGALGHSVLVSSHLGVRANVKGILLELVQVLVRARLRARGGAAGVRRREALRVRPESLRGKALRPLKVFVSVLSEAAGASHARRRGAGRNLLRGEVDVVIGAHMKCEHALDCFGHGEGPARATLALILDRRYGLGLAPVNVLRHGGEARLEHRCVVAVRRRKALNATTRRELIAFTVRVEGEAETLPAVLAFQVLNLLQLGAEELEPVLFLCGVLVLFVERSLVLLEILLRAVCSRDNGGDEQRNAHHCSTLPFVL